jgi:crotonobetainyl-CoA:carnitine CoA-transferase CaiB-like acyl-CoA transferase
MGPLAGIKVVELAGIGPAPMCAMILADLGATVLRIDRKQPSGLGLKRPLKYDLMLRSRKSIALDLKTPDGLALALQLIDGADALIESFRPGVTDRLGLGPGACLERNPRLVYGRMTGWGQTGPLAMAAGHDLNYISITGILNALGRKDQPPTVPLNVVGDFGAGSLHLALGILAGILEARSSGRGQVVDAAIVDGAVSMATCLIGMYGAGTINNERGANILDSGAYFYDVYECADGKYVSVAPLEEKFYLELLQRIGVDPAAIGPHMDRDNWGQGRAVLSEKFKTKTRGQWQEILEGTDACFAPVLSWDEAPDHPHL